jgi:hypothetical protein
VALGEHEVFTHEVYPAQIEGVITELVSNAHGVVAAEVWLNNDAGLLERARGGYARKKLQLHPEGTVPDISLAKFGELAGP